MIPHGGNLDEAIAHYGGTRAGWLDLSTGINPHAYPVAALHTDIWHRLPEPSNAIMNAAERYYGWPNLLPVAGSQAVIQALPRLRNQSSTNQVCIAAPSYAEYVHQWRSAGHKVAPVSFAELAEPQRAGDTLNTCDVLIVCNPNNPTGECLPPVTLLDWAQRLTARGGWLIVDEAFGDTLAENSLFAHLRGQAWPAGLIVLRSVGKFFGLAGLRLGFVACAEPLRTALADWLGPWTIHTAAQQIGVQALQDKAWHSEMRHTLRREGQRLKDLLHYFELPSQGTDLFRWWPTSDAAAWQHHFATQHIWVRRFLPTPDGWPSATGIRLGLPPNEAGWQRLTQALASFSSRSAATAMHTHIQQTQRVA